jgi:hypothetical protein
MASSIPGRDSLRGDRGLGTEVYDKCFHVDQPLYAAAAGYGAHHAGGGPDSHAQQHGSREGGRALPRIDCRTRGRQGQGAHARTHTRGGDQTHAYNHPNQHHPGQHRAFNFGTDGQRDGPPGELFETGNRALLT